jgi:D-alanyl-D-alanine carboxypeptidase/D-alanyl-D-alanine-endopeptidase (penicillin-binding protein 4)
MRIISSILCLCLSAMAFGQISQDVKYVAEDATFEQAVVGICVMDRDGKILAGVNTGKMLLPASNMKLISTGAALHTLGPDFSFETTLAYDGAIEDGVLKGNLHIIGGGDPTLGSKDSIAVQIEKTFAAWSKMIKDAGIRKIEGRIIGDGRHFEGAAEEPTWLWNDIGIYYGAGVTGLMFYENMQSFSVSAGKAVGEPVNIRPSYPDCPWMDFRYACSTGKAGTGDQLYMYTSDLAPVAEIRGTFGVDRAAKRVDCANKFPEYTCAKYFEDYLKKKGVTCEGGAADYRLVTDWKELSDTDKCNGTLTVLGSTQSPTLDRIVYETNHASNNAFAETLFRTLGKNITGSACYDSSYVAMTKVLAQLGVKDTKAMKIQDGSGLSRQNLISPEALCRFLCAMGYSPAFNDFLESLPSPGFTGTLEFNMKGQPAELRQRIKVKSGSMSGVRCYSGYILPSVTTGETSVENGSSNTPEGTLIISIMTNNCTSPNWKVRPMLDKLMVALAKHN